MSMASLGSRVQQTVENKTEKRVEVEGFMCKFEIESLKMDNFRVKI